MAEPDTLRHFGRIGGQALLDTHSAPAHALQTFVDTALYRGIQESRRHHKSLPELRRIRMGHGWMRKGLPRRFLAVRPPVPHAGRPLPHFTRKVCSASSRDRDSLLRGPAAVLAAGLTGRSRKSVSRGNPAAERHPRGCGNQSAHPGIEQWIGIQLELPCQNGGSGGQPDKEWAHSRPPPAHAPRQRRKNHHEKNDGEHKRCDRPHLLPLPLVATVAAPIAGNGCPLCSWRLQVAANRCRVGRRNPRPSEERSPAYAGQHAGQAIFGNRAAATPGREAATSFQDRRSRTTAAVFFMTGFIFFLPGRRVNRARRCV